MLLALVPFEFGISVFIIVLVKVITGNVGLANGIGLAFIPLIIWLLNGSGMLIAYSLALVFFLTIKFLPGLIRTRGTIRKTKGLIFDREYHFWQIRKK